MCCSTLYSFLPIRVKENPPPTSDKPVLLEQAGPLLTKISGARIHTAWTGWENTTTKSYPRWKFQDICQEYADSVKGPNMNAVAREWSYYEPEDRVKKLGPPPTSKSHEKRAKHPDAPSASRASKRCAQTNWDRPWHELDDDGSDTDVEPRALFDQPVQVLSSPQALKRRLAKEDGTSARTTYSDVLNGSIKVDATETLNKLTVTKKKKKKPSMMKIADHLTQKKEWTSQNKVHLAIIAKLEIRLQEVKNQRNSGLTQYVSEKANGECARMSQLREDIENSRADLKNLYVKASEVAYHQSDESVKALQAHLTELFAKLM